MNIIYNDESVSFALHQFHSILFPFSFSAVSVGLSSSEVDNSTNNSPIIVLIYGTVLFVIKYRYNYVFNNF